MHKRIKRVKRVFNVFSQFKLFPLLFFALSVSLRFNFCSKEFVNLTPMGDGVRFHSRHSLARSGLLVATSENACMNPIPSRLERS